MKKPRLIVQENYRHAYGGGSERAAGYQAHLYLSDKGYVYETGEFKSTAVRHVIAKALQIRLRALVRSIERRIG